MPEYDSTNFHPPAPVANVTLRNPGNRSLTVEASLLIDTGADITLIPSHLVVPIGVMPLADKHYELLGFNGSASTAQAVVLDLMFLGRRFHGQYLLCDQN